jgi:Ras-related GTP-binding protein C/D
MSTDESEEKVDVEGLGQPDIEEVASTPAPEKGAVEQFPSSKEFEYPGIYNDSEPSTDANGALLSGGEAKPRILLMGLRRSGKSSIQKVVFHKMSPNETLFLESTNKVVKEDIANSSFVQFHIWDFPGQIDFFDPTFDSDMIFGGCGALIFVIDAQDDYMEALERLHTTVTKAHKSNPRINFEVFIHKVDGLSEDYKMETQRDIHQRATDDLVDSGFEQVHLSFHLTSIYDHSIFEAFSKVVQKLIPQLPTLENLLNIFISNSSIEKAFLFDVVSKIYIATDSSPVDMQSYELCCDMIDVVIDVSSIYGSNSVDDVSPAFDLNSQASIRLNNGTVLHLREVNRFLALVCILRDNAMEKQGMIDYNFVMFRQAIQKVFEVRKNQSKYFRTHELSPDLNHHHGESPP